MRATTVHVAMVLFVGFLNVVLCVPRSLTFYCLWRDPVCPPGPAMDKAEEGSHPGLLEPGVHESTGWTPCPKVGEVWATGCGHI